MNKQDFLTKEPVYFRLLGDKFNTYRFIADKDSDLSGFITKNGPHYCNVDRVTWVGIHFYTYCFHKAARGILKYEHLERITEAEYKH